jgi:Sec-independent protein secretion pathway component TatC
LLALDSIMLYSFDIVQLIILALPFIILYELSILIIKHIEKKRQIQTFT